MVMVSKGNSRDCYKNKQTEDKGYWDGRNWRHPSEEWILTPTPAIAYGAICYCGHYIYLIFKCNNASSVMTIENCLNYIKV